MVEEIKKVLAVVEPESETQPAIDRLAHLARLIEFDVRLIACDYSQYLVEGYYFSEAELPALREQYLDERKELLEELAQPLRDGGLEVSTEAVWSHPSYKAIVEIVEDYQPDLVIHHVRRHAALSRMLLSNDDWQMTRHCPAPLLLVKNKPWKPEPVILAAVDPLHARHKPGGLDHRIMDEAKMFAAHAGGELYAVHAYGQFPLSGIYPDEAKKRHGEAFTTLMDEYDMPESRRILVDEAPEYAIRELESELSVDLVVVGAISRSLLSDVFIGNTTEKVLDFVDCDALVLKPVDLE